MSDTTGVPGASGQSRCSHRGWAISVASTIGLVGVIALLTLTTRSTPMPAATGTRMVADTPSSRPFPAPVTTTTYALPASIDATGRTDVSSALIRFIASVPDGSIISFPAGGVFGITKAISFGSGSRHNLVFDGNGATIMYISNAGQTEDYSIWYDTGGGANLTFENFTLIGSSTTPGVYAAGQEGQHGVLVQSSYVEVANCSISAVWGDGLFVEGSDNVWFHNNHVLSAGRNGLSVISGTNVTAEYNAFDKVGYTTFDDEPNVSTEASTNIMFRNNTAGTWDNSFFSVEGSHTGAPIHGITVSGNAVIGASLVSIVDNGGASTMSNIVFTNNRSTVNASGPVLRFAHIDGLTVMGNVQPLSSGGLASITDSTRVTYRP